MQGDTESLKLERAQVESHSAWRQADSCSRTIQSRNTAAKRVNAAHDEDEWGEFASQFDSCNVSPFQVDVSSLDAEPGRAETESEVRHAGTLGEDTWGDFVFAEPQRHPAREGAACIHGTPAAASKHHVQEHCSGCSTINQTSAASSEHHCRKLAGKALHSSRHARALPPERVPPAHHATFSSCNSTARSKGGSQCSAATPLCTPLFRFRVAGRRVRG
jgi:hypothetical protein